VRFFASGATRVAAGASALWPSGASETEKVLPLGWRGAILYDFASYHRPLLNP
jgi:hypothetical protein